MPYGISSGSEVFQQTMEQMFDGYQCQIVVDDILVWQKTIDEHDKNLRRILNPASKVKLKLNKQKCKINVREVAYVGHILTSEGLKPDPDKIKAITDMPPPTVVANVLTP